VYINAQAGADLSAGDEIIVNDFKIKPSRGYMTMPAESGSSAVQAMIDKDAPGIELTLTLTKSTAVSAGWLNAMYNGTQFKAKIVQDAGVIPGKTAHYLRTIWLPCIMVADAPDIGQDTPKPVTVRFRSLRKGSAPTGMTYGVPYMQTVNEVPALTGYPTI